MKIQIYEGKAGGQKGKWRWRVFARNGRIVAESGEGYTSRNKALLAFLKFERAVRSGIELKT